MKRKIAAIFAADVVGYSRMIAEDEEDTLQCLASYRQVMDDFIAKASGRIFNTGGDSVFAEFSSSVEAVRAAIDIQEALRSQNLQRSAERQMNFRIGITVGDVVERDGDLLGDGRVGGQPGKLALPEIEITPGQPVEIGRVAGAGIVAFGRHGRTIAQA